MGKRTAIYCRVSTKDQSTENQKRDLIRYCEQRELTIVEIFEDHGVSGSKQNRPALDDMMSKARQGLFDTVFVWKFDRFARSTRHLITALNEFQELGIDFISYNEGVDTSTSVGKMVFTFLGAIAEFEKNLIIERTKAGLRTAKAKGKVFGRPKCPFDMNKAIELKSQGVGLRQIGEIMKVSHCTVRNYLKMLDAV
jgi:DNA invertase Pin-like site-specific DNA recombinase